MSGLVSAKDLREKRANLAKQAQAVLDAASAATRGLTTEEEQSFDRISAEIDTLAVSVDRIEKHEARMASLGESRGRVVPPDAPGTSGGSESPEQLGERREGAMRDWMMYGTDGLTPEARGLLAPTQASADGTDHTQRIIGSRDARTIRFAGPRERRALAVGTTTAGGFAIPQGFSGQLEASLLEYGGMMTAGNVFDTDSGADLPWPTYDDTAQVGAILAENTGASEQDVTFGQIIFKAYKYSSKMVRVPIELMQDSAFAIDSFLAPVLGERLGRILNTHFTVGTNSSQPQGVVAASSAGKTGITGQTVAVIYDDLVDLIHSIDPAIRRQAGVAFMMNDLSVRVVRKLKDSTGRPLWEPGVQVGQPDSLLGYNVLVNQDVAVMAANAKSILFGNFKKYMIRRVKDVTLVRLVERYGELHQIAFLAFARFDGRLLDPGTDPVKHYANSAT